MVGAHLGSDRAVRPGSVRLRDQQRLPRGSTLRGGLNTDAENCGKCGVVCPAGATCQAKVCTSPAPKITAAAPNIQMRSGSITITGTNFESTCSKNSVTLAGVTAAPTTCSKSSLTLTVPGSASYGPTQVVVTVAQKASNSYGFTVAREFGSFVEITNDVAGNTSPRSCPNGGAVRLDICKPTCPGYPEGQAAALFLRQSTNKLIGSPYGFRFHAPTVKGLGGAGFSRCSVGLVLNADIGGSGINHLMALHFLDLDTGKSFQGSPLCFDWWTGTPDHAYSPRILRSPDGTILMLVSAAPAPENIAATLLDKVKGGKLLTRIGSKGLAERVQATITSKNEITLDIGGSTHVDGIKID